jgi:preprotein translocase subunit SecA
MFKEMVEHIQEEVTKYIMKAHVESNLERQEVAKGQTETGGSGEPQAKRPVKKEERVGRNDPCPCGSGKKYKQCHGQ